MLIIKEIIRAITIIESIPVPHHIIINGPSATLGNEFNTVKYGSTILDSVSFNHNIDAINRPRNDAIKKLTNVS